MSGSKKIIGFGIAVAMACAMSVPSAAAAPQPAAAESPTTSSSASKKDDAGVTVPNGGFERKDDSWTASSWEMTKTVWVTDAAAHSGTYAQAVNQWNNDVTLSQKLTAKPGTYDVSLYVWANEALGASKLVANGASAGIASAGAVQIDGTKTWDQITVPQVAVGEDGVLDVAIVIDKLASTTLEGYIDDVEVTPSGDSGDTDDPANGDGADDHIADNGFEDGGGAWTLTGGAAVAEGGHGGTAHALRLAGPAEQRASQTVKADDGYYTLTAWARNNGGQDEFTIYASQPGRSAAKAAVPRTDFPAEPAGTWKKVTLRGVHVTGGELTVGAFSTGGDASEGILDSFHLTREDGPYEMLNGGDITELTYVEDSGGVFYDADGTRRDPVEIAAENGWNIVRIRVYNNPGKGRGDGTYYVPEGYQDADDALRLARRAAAAGLKIQLSFHYSDTWTNPGAQTIPADWQKLIEGKSDAEAVAILATQVHDFTADLLKRMAKQGTTPDYVSIGNETRSGMLFPYGKTSDWDNLARFYNAGAKAVREQAPDAKVIIHLDSGGDTALYRQYFGNAESHGVDYDVIGSSFYPYWTQKSAAQYAKFATDLSHEFGKPVMCMEVGMNWTGDQGAGGPGQLKDNGPYGDAASSTPRLQKEFMIDFFNAMQGVDGGMAIGSLYWDPIMLYAGGRTGWAYFEKDGTADVNVVDNTALFDFDGHALPAFDAYRQNTLGSAQGAIRGRVVDAAGNGVDGAAVTAKAVSGSGTLKATTNRYGDYYIPKAAAGDYAIAVRGGTLGDGSASATLAAGGTAEAGEVRLSGTQRLHALTGVVRGEDGTTPVGGASVYVKSKTDGGYATAVNTDDSGAYAFTLMPEGDYTVTVNADGHTTESFDVAIDGDAARDVTLHTNTGTISGTVLGVDGAPVDGAKVTVGDREALTGADGAFAIADVPSGTGLVVTASKDGYIDASADGIDVTAGRHVDGVELDLAARLDGAVSNGGFEEAGDGGVGAKDWSITGSADGVIGRTTRNDAAEGSYVVSMWHDKAFTADVTQTVSATQGSGVYVVSAQTYSGVTGDLVMRIEDESGRTLAERRVTPSASFGQTAVAAKVTGKRFAITFHADAKAGDWALLDQVQVGWLGTRTPAPDPSPTPGEGGSGADASDGAAGTGAHGSGAHADAARGDSGRTGGLSATGAGVTAAVTAACLAAAVGALALAVRARRRRR